jgi:hypothetical protein
MLGYSRRESTHAGSFSPARPRISRAQAPTPSPGRLWSSFATGTGSAATIQRKCDQCTSEDEQARNARSRQHPSSGASSAGDMVDGVVSSGSGRPLDPGTRGYFESRFGHDFRGVRVHTDARAAASADALGARAYTRGQEVVFRAGAYAPHATDGKRLLAHELAHVVQQSGASGASAGPQTARDVSEPADASEREADRAAEAVMHAPEKDGHSCCGGRHHEAPRPATLTPLSGGKVQRTGSASEDVWGLRVTTSMCSCRQRIRDDIAWANTAGATYATCDTAANPTSTEVEACFSAAQPTAVVVASTSSSGTITLPPASADPCERIADKAILVHETMHSRHADDMARAQGAAFFAEWNKLRGDPDRLDKLRVAFPAQVASFEAQWKNGHDWAQDEVNSYRWERRFLQDALASLNRICT